MAKKLTVTELVDIYEDYNFTVAQLKVLLKERGLPVSGAKDILMQRLFDDTIDSCNAAEELFQKGFKESALEVMVNKGCKNNEKYLIETIRSYSEKDGEYIEKMAFNDEELLGRPINESGKALDGLAEYWSDPFLSRGQNEPVSCVEQLCVMGAYGHVPEILDRISKNEISSINSVISDHFVYDDELAATGYSAQYWKDVVLGSMTDEEYLPGPGPVTHFWSAAGLDEGAVPKIIDYLKVAHKSFKDKSSKITVSYDPDNSYNLNRKKKHFTCNCKYFKRRNKGGVTALREGTFDEHRGYVCSHIEERIYRVLFSIQALAMICMSNSVRRIKLHIGLYRVLVDINEKITKLPKKGVSSFIDSLISKVERDTASVAVTRGWWNTGTNITTVKVDPVKEISEMLVSKSLTSEIGESDKYSIEAIFNRYSKPENTVAPEILAKVKKTLRGIAKSKRKVNDDVSFYIYDCSIKRTDRAVNDAAILALSLI